MKRLTLLRHAKSSWDESTARDFDRPLNARGRRAAQAMGRELRRLHLGFDMVVASPALRVVETLRELETGYAHSLHAHFDRRLYLASAEALLEIVHDAQESAASLLLVGHNPGLERLTSWLSGPNALRDQAAIKYPTATLAQIDFPITRWTQAGEANAGALTRFIRPRDLDPELGPDEES